MPPAPKLVETEICLDQDSPVPPAPESQGSGKVESKGVSVPPAPMPQVTGHGCELELATLSLGVAPLVPEGVVSTRNVGSTVAARSASMAAPKRPPVVCQSPIGEGIGKSRPPRINPSGK